MIVLSSTLTAAVDRLEKAHSAEKEELKELYFQHIRALERQIEDLKQLIFIPSRPNLVPPIHLEADAVMSSRDEVIEIDEEEAFQQDFILRERDRLFSGEHEFTEVQ